MTALIRVQSKETGEIFLATPDLQSRLTTHRHNPDCDVNGCAIHNPTPDAKVNREEWPYNWRDDKGMLERICHHGIGHPDPDSQRWVDRMTPLKSTAHAVHGCDGCCFDKGEEPTVFGNEGEFDDGDVFKIEEAEPADPWAPSV